MFSFQHLHIFMVAAFLLTKVEFSGSSCVRKRSFLKYYEKLSYDNYELLQKHKRSKRASEEEKQSISLDLFAYNRTFALLLKRDLSVFAEDVQVLSNNRPLPVDISFVYSGALKDYSLMKDKKSFELTLKKYQLLEKMKLKAKEEDLTRKKRSLDLSRTTCLLYLKADYLFYKRFNSIEQVISQISSYMTSVNTIYGQANFNGIKGINFKIKTLNVVQEDKPSSVMHPTFIGPEKLLMLHSESNWNNYCLSYLMTDRDYNGVLGLAWNGRPGNSGGICSKYSQHEGNLKTVVTLNTGIVTIQKYGQYLPPRLIHITLAHELGHSLGAPHDESQECAKFDTNSDNGNYLMFPYAMDGNQYNNDKFSPCSIFYIGNLLRVKKDQCFVESDRPTCGNQIVEEGEQCDVGYNDNDPCCYGAESAMQCTLKPGKQCSPSQGLCCSHSCSYKPKSQKCQEEGECTLENYCTGESSKCSKPLPKSNYTLCNLGTRICINGMCRQSVCAKFGMEQCDCNSESMHEKCQLCCQQPGNVYSCKSTKSVELERFFNGALVQLPPGSPCGNRQGYCDKFHICRLVDADGPIAMLKNSFLNLIELEDPATWMLTHWWAILLIILTLAALMAGTVFIFGRTLDSEKERQQNKEERRSTQQRSTKIVYSRKDDYVTAEYLKYQEKTYCRY
ncbi:disintegrin and metalloproteinase domain-containing protein 10 isoform X2 [Xenopus laevis]|uniref:ADAM10 endopeptidase n=1 Tax=Xenopus laevis TaxID=8355 RepID=A0A8J1M2A1_XENLA|nr:disintegrin and metalloproteinase domain-containing protein 10 isoform X2 [Xenopus laevis]